MLFKSLAIRNFASIDHIDLNLVNQGLVLILGVNEDASRQNSNGSGKSLLLDAFTWCLWGDTVRGFSSDELVHKLVGKNCSVSVVFEEDGVTYTCTRYRNQRTNLDLKINDLVLLADSKDTSGATVADTQALITDILGLDFVTFCAMMPGAGVRVAELTDANIKSLLERLLQTQVLGKAQKQVSEQVREQEKKLAVLGSQIESANHQLHSQRKTIDTLRENYETFDDKQKQALSRKKGLLQKAADEKVHLDSTIAKGQKATSIYAAAKHKLEAIRESIKQEHKFEEDLQSQFFAERAALDTGELDRLVIAEKQGLLQTIDSMGATCSKCLQAVPDSFKASTKVELHQEINVLQKRVEDAVEARRILEQSFRESTQPITQRVKALTAEESLAKIDLNKSWDVVQAATDASTSKTRLVESISMLNADIEQLEQEQNPFGDMLTDALAKQVEYQAQFKEIQEKYVTLRHALAINQFWLKGFSPSGLRSFMLEHIIPILNASAKKYSDLLTAGEMSITFHTKQKLKSGKQTEKFNIQVSQQHGGLSYQSNSMGERARANLVIALALGELASMRANKRIPFRFLDEPFENVDESGTEAIVELLNQQKELYDTVFVVTHQDHFKQLFPKKLVVKKSNGFSRLVDE